MAKITEAIDDIRAEHGSLRCWLLGHKWVYEDFGGGYCGRCYKPDEVSSESPRILERISIRWMRVKHSLGVRRLKYYERCPDCHKPYRNTLFHKYNHDKCLPF